MQFQIFGYTVIVKKTVTGPTRRELAAEGIWLDKEGNEYYPEQMTDRHLLNVHHALVMRARRLARTPAGEEKVLWLHPFYPYLSAELDKRDL